MIAEYRDWLSRVEGLGTAELAYLAGIIDGEGCVTITAHQNKYESSKSVSPSFVAHVSVANTDVRLMDWLTSRLGGWVGLKRRNYPCSRQKPVYTWQLTSDRARAMLRIVRPYLVLKGAQADIVMATDRYLMPKKSCFKRRIPSELLQKRAIVVAQIRKLNRRGPVPVEEVS